MIDISELSVGDNLTVHAQVFKIDTDGTAMINVGGNSFWIYGESIATHEPRPKEIVVGGKVMTPGGEKLNVIGVYGDFIWTKSDSLAPHTWYKDLLTAID